MYICIRIIRGKVLNLGRDRWNMYRTLHLLPSGQVHVLGKEG